MGYWFHLLAGQCGLYLFLIWLHHVQVVSECQNYHQVYWCVSKTQRKTSKFRYIIKRYPPLGALGKEVSQSRRFSQASILSGIWSDPDHIRVTSAWGSRLRSFLLSCQLSCYLSLELFFWTSPKALIVSAVSFSYLWACHYSPTRSPSWDRT